MGKLKNLTEAETLGKLIVIEGSDGSGKATQTRKLYDRLSDLEGKVKRLSFPNYESESSALIRMYLREVVQNKLTALKITPRTVLESSHRVEGFL